MIMKLYRVDKQSAIIAWKYWKGFPPFILHHNKYAYITQYYIEKTLNRWLSRNKMETSDARNWNLIEILLNKVEWTKIEKEDISLFARRIISKILFQGRGHWDESSYFKSENQQQSAQLSLYP